MIRTVEPSSFEEYLADQFDSATAEIVEVRRTEESERRARLTLFPFAVMLKVSFAEYDFANRWCWEMFGPADGECLQHGSRYSACDRSERHTHVGRWMTHWYVKIEYDFGFCEWCFAEARDGNRFLQFVPEIHWGERFLK